MSRPASQASRAPSQCSNGSVDPAQRQKLLELKAKLSAALEEVEGELNCSGSQILVPQSSYRVSLIQHNRLMVIFGC